MSTTASATASASASAADGGHASIVDNSNPTFKIVGVCLAVGSGLFIGTSFVIKKKGLLKATAKSGNAAGEGHAYLKNWMWWLGMIMMIVGEILNFVAYAFTVAILVTAMGSISVVVAALLSHFFLKETLTFFGWIGCILCILGSIILALNAPENQAARTINEFKAYFISPGFMVWVGICFAASLVIVFYVAPRWGKKNMMPYISVCSLVGGISVSCTQGLGSSIITSIQGDSQIKNWFFWFLLIFVVVTLLIEINYLNKALELFNTSMVVPVYFCYFTSATMVSSFILYRGLKAPAVTLITMVLGFLVTCFGITLLQMSKVDPKKLQGLDRRSTMLMAVARHGTEDQETGKVSSLEDPGIDALRGGFGAAGSIIRARSMSRRLSDASSMARTQPYGTNDLNTHGMAHLARYQLSDAPMATETLEYHSPSRQNSVAGPVAPVITPKRSMSALKFENSDVVHHYGYSQHDGHTDASHSVRPHDMARDHAGSVPSSPSMPRVLERDEVLLSQSPEKEHTEFLDHSHPGLPRTRSPLSSPQHDRERKTSFSQLFQLTSPKEDNDDMVRGGSARGMRDYPHLAHDERATEREERTALVNAADEEMDDRPDDRYDYPNPYVRDAEGDLSSPPSGRILSAKAGAGERRPGGPRGPKGPR